MPHDTAPSTLDAKPAATKAKLIWQAWSALDVADAEQRALDHDVLRMLPDFLNRGDCAVFLWGAKGMALLCVQDNPKDGRFAWFSWLQQDPQTTFADILPTIHRWAENQGCLRIAAAVEKGTPDAWQRLTGYEPWKLIIASSL